MPEIIAIALLISSACALPGCWLVLKRMSMMTDAITHTILLGIVLAFFIVGDLSHPALIVGAAALGLATVWAGEALARRPRVHADAAIGVVFPLFFSLAVVLIALFANKVHLDTDAVLMGELAFAPFDRLVINGWDLGARGLYVGGGLMLINTVFMVVFHKQLTLASFDPDQAKLMGYAPRRMHYALMALVSSTAVASFAFVGSILVVSFMVVPACCGLVLYKRLPHVIATALIVALLSTLIGVPLAFAYDITIAGTIACVAGLIFIACLIYTNLVRCILHTRQAKRSTRGEDAYQESTISETLSTKAITSC